MKYNKLFIKWIVTLVMFIIVCSMNALVWAETYYIDYQNGSDLNDGVSTSTAWKHSPGDINATGTVVSAGLLPGDVVKFKKGISYLGQIDITWSGAHITSGSTAKITSVGVITDTNATFLTDGVTTSHYIYIYHSKPSIYNTWVESSGLFRISSIDSETQITLSDFDGKAHSTAEMTYAITNPITFKSDDSWGTGYATIDAEDIRYHAFTHINYGYLRFEGLRIINVAYDGSNHRKAAIYGNRTGNYNQVINCRFETIKSSANSSGSHLVFKNNYSYDIYYVSFTEGPVNYGLFENNWAEYGSRTALGGRFMIVRNNTIKDMYRSIYGHADSIGFIDQGPTNDYDYGWIYGNTIDDFVEGIALYGTTIRPSYFVIHSNLFIGRKPVTGHGDNGILSEGSRYIYVLNNTFLSTDAGNGFIKAITFASDTSYYIIKNNLFSGSEPLNITSGDTVGHDIDYNHYYTTDPTPFWYAGSNITWAAWQALGYDINSLDLDADPKFVSTSYASPDAHLQSNSPDIDRGLNFSSIFTVDKDGNTRSGVWDLGAYEYGPSLNKPKNLRLIQ